MRMLYSVSQQNPRNGSVLNTSIADSQSDLSAELDDSKETLAGVLSKNVRVFCWIMTQPKNRARSIAVKETWAKRCNDYVFISSEDDASLPSLNASATEGRNTLWGKTKFGFT